MKPSEFNRIEKLLNNSPRECLQHRTPHEVFGEAYGARDGWIGHRSVARFRVRLESQANLPHLPAVKPEESLGHESPTGKTAIPPDLCTGEAKRSLVNELHE